MMPTVYLPVEHDDSILTCQVIEKLKSCIQIDQQADPNIMGTYDFQVLLPNGQQVIYTLDLRKGQVLTCDADQQKRSHQADCCYLVDSADILPLLNGKLDFAKAYLSGKLKVQGNTAAAFKLHRFMMDAMAAQNKQPLISKGSNNTAKHILNSDVIFETIRTRLNEQPDLVKKIPLVVQINLTDPSTHQPTAVATWTLDTKSPTARIYRWTDNVDPFNTKPDAIITIQDDHLVALLFGKINPQKLFITGKMKIKGSIMLLQRLNQFWHQIHQKHQTEDSPYVQHILLNSQLKPDLASELVFFKLLGRLAKSSGQMKQVPACQVRLTITSKGRPVVQWILSYQAEGLLNSVEHKILEEDNHKNLNNNYGQHTNDTSTHLELIVEDEHFCHLVSNQQHNANWLEAIHDGRVLWKGDRSLLDMMVTLFQLDHHHNQQQLKAKL